MTTEAAQPVLEALSKQAVLAVAFPRDRLKELAFGGSTLVAGITERVDASRGAEYANRYPMTTSLLVRAEGGRETVWRPDGPPSTVSGYPLGDDIAVTQLLPRPAAECAPQKTSDCVKLTLWSLRTSSLKARVLHSFRPTPIELIPEPAFRGRTAYLTEAAQDGTSRLLSIDLDTGDDRPLATIPFSQLRLSVLAGSHVLVSEDGAPDRLVTVDITSGKVATLPSHPGVVAGAKAIAWVEPLPGTDDGRTRIRVGRPDGTPLNAFGRTDFQTYYVQWVDEDTLLAVTVMGFDLYRRVTSAQPSVTRLEEPAGLPFAPEVAVQSGDGRVGFGLVDEHNVVHYAVLRV